MESNNTPNNKITLFVFLVNLMEIELIFAVGVIPNERANQITQLLLLDPYRDPFYRINPIDSINFLLLFKGNN